MGPGTEFEAKQTVTAGKKLSKAKTDLAEAVRKWAFDNGLMVKRRKELWVRTANAIAFILMRCSASSAGAFRPPCGRCHSRRSSCSPRASWKDGVGTRRTDSGRELWSRAGGFHRMLTTDSAETRFDFGARKDLYTAYVPFAVAAGAAALWAKKYQTTTGTVAPQPDWYNSSSTTSAGFVRGLRWAELRQLRVCVVVVDRRLHRIAVLVVQQQRRWRWLQRRRRRGGGGGGGGGSW